MAQQSLLVGHAERCAGVAEEEAYEEAEAEMDQVDGRGADEEEDRGSSAGNVAARLRPAFAELFGGAHARIVGVGRSLLAYCALSGCPQLLAYVGSALLQMEIEVGEPLAALPAASCGGLDLLACAPLEGGGPVLRVAAEWAARSSAEGDWRAQAPGRR